MSVKEPLNLASIHIFSDLNPIELKRIENICLLNVYQTGDQIIDQMSHTRDVYFIIKGGVRVTSLASSGKEVTLETLNEGKCFGELAAIDGCHRSSSVIAVKASSIISMPAADFLNLLAEYPSLALKVMIMMASVIRTSCDRITDLITLGANARVISELLKRIQQQGYDKYKNKVLVENFPVHNEIARRASTTRETVTRVLSALSKKGIIRRTGTTLEVYDIAVIERTFQNLSDSDI